MPSTAFSANLESLRFFVQKLSDKKVQDEIMGIANEKGVVAIISQSVAETFDQEGPGWAPLKNKTIRSSVKGKAKKAVADMTDKELERHEKWSRKPGAKTVQPFRRILQRTGLLKKTVTVPGYTGTGKTGVTGSNIYKVEKTTITWGTSLVYAKVQNQGGGPSKLPARPFLKPLSPKWQTELDEFLQTKIVSYLRRAWGEILK